MRAMLQLVLLLLLVFMAGNLDAQEDASLFTYAMQERLSENEYTLSVVTVDLNDGSVIERMDIDSAMFFTHTVWSDDGQWLIYTRYVQARQEGDYSGGQLMAWEFSTDEPFVIASGSDYNFPPTFLPDGRIAHPTWTQSTLQVKGARQEFEIWSIYDVMAYDIAPDAMGEKLTNIYYSSGCGGSASTPSEYYYLGEAGFRGNAMFFTAFEDEIVFTSMCARTQFGRTNTQTGDISIVQDPRLGGARIAPSGERLIGTNPDSELTILNFDFTFSTEVISTTAAADQIVWVDEDTIIYSTRERLSEIPLSEEAAAQFETIMQYPPPTYYDYRGAIYELDLTSGEERLLYESQAYAIGRMSLTPDGTGLVFSEIEDVTAWLQIFSTTDATERDADFRQAGYDAINVYLVHIPLESLNPRNDLLLLGFNQLKHSVRP